MAKCIRIPSLSYLSTASLSLILSFFFFIVYRPHVQPMTLCIQLRLTVQFTDFNNNVKFTSPERNLESRAIGTEFSTKGLLLAYNDISRRTLNYLRRGVITIFANSDS